MERDFEERDVDGAQLVETGTRDLEVVVSETAPVPEVAVDDDGTEEMDCQLLKAEAIKLAYAG